jgi:hypothetical protein
MIFLFGVLVVIAVVAGIVLLASGDRYSRMSDKEFEEEAKRGSAIGGAVLELQKILGGPRHVEYLQKRDKRVEEERAESGDRPQTGTDVKGE